MQYILNNKSQNVPKLNLNNLMKQEEIKFLSAREKKNAKKFI